MYHRSGKMVRRDALLDARPDLAPVYDAVDALFPVRVTSSWASRAVLDDHADPLALQVLPHPAELDDDGLDDPVGEKAHSPVPWLVRKYRDRALLLVTKRCHLYCRYCFRRTHAPGEALDPTDAELDAAFAYLAGAEGLREVILSGGDPLILPRRRLLGLIDRVAALGLRVRVHTRAPVSFPEAVDPDLARELAGRGVFVVVHCNHPRELADDVRASLATLVDAGVPVLCQTVLLAGVNDDPAVLTDLFETLARLRVRPYYLHHPDAVTGNAHFRVPVERGLAIYAAVRETLGGVALPRYVWDPPDGGGKRDVAPGPDRAI
ncbi:MAG: KamA family radical SAM protein [Alphaproteobacteria bacterium]|nr:KamA family radical SAM protein [Alphaproteobacteria bacterium]